MARRIAKSLKGQKVAKREPHTPPSIGWKPLERTLEMGGKLTKSSTHRKSPPAVLEGRQGKRANPYVLDLSKNIEQIAKKGNFTVVNPLTEKEMLRPTAGQPAQLAEEAKHNLKEEMQFFTKNYFYPKEGRSYKVVIIYNTPNLKVLLAKASGGGVVKKIVYSFVDLGWRSAQSALEKEGKLKSKRREGNWVETVTYKLDLDGNLHIGEPKKTYKK